MVKKKRDPTLVKARDGQTKPVRTPLLTPQQEKFLEYYYDPKSETFSNIYQSGIRAGYSEGYAKIMKSSSIGNLWIRQNNKYNMGADHIIAGIQRIAVMGFQDKDKLRALELLAKLHGMIVDKQVTGHVNVEDLLKDLK